MCICSDCWRCLKLKSTFMIFNFDQLISNIIRGTTILPLERQISIKFTTFTCFSNCKILISRRAVIGNYKIVIRKSGSVLKQRENTFNAELTPSFSLSIRTFFIATYFLGFFRSRALNTSLEQVNTF